ncbi:PREDICTED: fatty acyl-CoA reductase 1-like [Nicrophorus vespilloides]|uniref:Fatty acyl-CoA reductase n=1 Tax=Nicrophorus vespilloides TaxID=110193 RepID=A0ABM1N1D2_NICVS|nr:PREDICTED: fatty acyl-CoA reductase 1-like [Nicrophorus vespilloides]
MEEFYRNKTILVTGCTGFLGSMLVEKFLRIFPDLSKLYLLARKKGPMSFNERSKEYFEDPIFERMISVNPNYYERVQWIEGDLTMPQLNLSNDDLQAMKTVDIIIHIGASINMQNPLHEMIKNNLLGTSELLKISLDNKNIKCFMYVSSAFSNARRSCSRIEEKIYDPVLKPETLLDIYNSLTNEELNEIENTLMQDWPNSYTFSKNVTEYHCDTFNDQMSVGIFRPGNITSSISEPFPYWVKSKAGLVGAIMLLGSKTLPSYYIKNSAISHAVPVDMTANALITCTYDVVKNKSKDSKIYNYTSNNNPITYYDAYMIGDGIQLTMEEFNKNKTIFVTGCTGFLGYMLVEKLLRNTSKGLTDDELDKIECTLMQDWPNSYTFTKNANEYHCDTFKDQFSIGIFRPGISEPT